jgi:hypothetical protein
MHMRDSHESENKLTMCPCSSLTVDSLYGLKLFVTNRNTKLDFPTPESPNSTTYTRIHGSGQNDSKARGKDWGQLTFTSRGLASILVYYAERKQDR